MFIYSKKKLIMLQCNWISIRSIKKQSGVFRMYYDFLQRHTIICDEGQYVCFNWNNAMNKFLCYTTVSPTEIALAKERLNSVGYELPEDLERFWSEVGCGYLCSNFLADNVLEGPQALLDIYFSEGEWSTLKKQIQLFDENELPFLRTSNFNYITIGIENGVNMGRIYFNGLEIAASLSEFINRLLENPIYYQELQLI